MSQGGRGPEGVCVGVWVCVKRSEVRSSRGPWLSRFCAVHARPRPGERADLGVPGRPVRHRERPQEGGGGKGQGERGSEQKENSLRRRPQPHEHTLIILLARICLQTVKFDVEMQRTFFSASVKLFDCNTQCFSPQVYCHTSSNLWGLVFIPDTHF